MGRKRAQLGQRGGFGGVLWWLHSGCSVEGGSHSEMSVVEVSTCACIHTCIPTYSGAHGHTHARVCICTCMRTYMHVYVYVIIRIILYVHPHVFDLWRCVSKGASDVCVCAQKIILHLID